MSESVESDAFVIPGSVSLPDAARPRGQYAVVLFAELEASTIFQAGTSRRTYARL